MRTLRFNEVQPQMNKMMDGVMIISSSTDEPKKRVIKWRSTRLKRRRKKKEMMTHLVSRKSWNAKIGGEKTNATEMGDIEGLFLVWHNFVLNGPLDRSLCLFARTAHSAHLLPEIRYRDPAIRVSVRSNGITDNGKFTMKTDRSSSSSSSSSSFSFPLHSSILPRSFVS